MDPKRIAEARQRLHAVRMNLPRSDLPPWAESLLAWADAVQEALDSTPSNMPSTVGETVLHIMEPDQEYTAHDLLQVWPLDAPCGLPSQEKLQHTLRTLAKRGDVQRSMGGSPRGRHQRPAWHYQKPLTVNGSMRGPVNP